MRRFLVIAFATAATFTVLANNFIPVSAPTADEVVAYRPAGPNGAARLSDQFVPTAAAPIAHAPAAAAPAKQPDLAAFEPHASAPATVENVGIVSAPETTLVAAQATRPSSNFLRQRLLSLPSVTVMPDALAAITQHHSVVGSLDSVVAERLAVSPDAVAARDLIDLNDPFAKNHSIVSALAAFGSDRESVEAEAAKAEAKFIPLTAGATNIFASIEAKPFAKLPAMIVTPAVLLDSAAIHNAVAGVETATDRTSFDADAARERPVTAMFITAAYSAPTESIFHRARYVVEPYAPVSSNVLAVADQVHAAVPVSEAITERNAIEADTATVPTAALVAASTEAPSANFDRQRLVAEPAAPVSVDALASTDEHAISNSETVASEREISNVTADTATRPTYVPSFLSALAEVPSAVIRKIGLVAMPEAPATTDALAATRTEHAVSATSAWFEAERATAQPDAATIAAKEPVLISTQTAMNADILKPMSAGPLVDAPLLNENAVASNGSFATPFDRMIDTPDVPEAVLKARPVLISANNDFSADLLKPMNASINPFVKIDNDQVLSAMQQTNNYCDPNFVGPPIRFSQTVELKLDDLLRQLHQRFGVNFIVGKGVADLPMNIKAGSIPWNVLLKSQLFISGVRARCIDQNTIELVENATLPSLQDMADVETRFIKLKFLQRTSGGTVDLAGRSQGGGGGQNGSQGGCGGSSQGGQSGGGSFGGGGGGGQGGQQGETAGSQASSKFDKLIQEIEKILGIRSMTASSSGGGGDQGGAAQQSQERRTNRFVTQIPGRNILAIRATEEEFKLIDQILVRADRPPFQVVIKGLVYSANQDRLRDIGVQTNIFGGTSDGRQTGEVTGHTIGTGTLFDFSAILGTFDFNVQATALQQNGVISVKSRPFATVLDGLCTTLEVGRQLPIVIDSSLGGQGTVTFVDASNNLAVTPYVVDDDNGNPIAVTLELRLAANDVDSSVTARGVPAISKRSVQTQLLLSEDKTAILGGFTVDQDSRSVSKTPGLGDIPIIGELFKRRIRDTRINRLYFAISVDVIPFGEAIRPVDVPGATTDPPSITPEQKKRADNAEPKQVKGP